MKKIILFAAAAIILNACSPQKEEKRLYNGWIISGEPTHESVILHARITSVDSLVNNDVPGAEGVGYFEVSASPDFSAARKTAWLRAVYENDFTLKTRVEGLEPDKTYYYRVLFGADSINVNEGKKGEFRTLPGANSTAAVSFIAVTGMNYERFLDVVPFKPSPGQPNTNYVSATPEDKKLGYPAFETILKAHKPTFWVGDGDNVYYDAPNKETRAISKDELRAKWHRLFAFPRAQQFFSSVPTVWLKDDHDYRFNDSDSTNAQFTEPSHDLGIYTFKEVVPVTDLTKPSEKTYRTYRLNKHVQIWYVEGRDYRSPMTWPDGPEKTLWGKEQLAWLQKTLLESDAAYKILLSPTPLVGPDDHRNAGDTLTLDKKDNHADPGGYKYEGDQFFQWLKENNFNSSNFFIVNGDRHWQYHSIHPTGIHEFCTGAFVRQNARIGRKPGEQNSTDPKGLIKQPYLQPRPTGAFLKVSVPASETKPDVLIEFIEETGEKLYSFTLPKQSI